MYSYEIREFLRERNYYIGGDDLLKIINPKFNPQIKEIHYNPGEKLYYMIDDQNEEFFFYAMNYQEAVNKGLVKKKKD
jgi:hypothetical protein